MALVHCPTCLIEFESGQTLVMPFCSLRCQQVDLGGWLDEQHGVPVEHNDEEAANEAESFDS